MSLRWTAYVAPKPPNGAQKRKLVIFPSTTSLEEILLKDVNFYLQCWAKVTHPLQKRDFQSIFAGTASAAKPSSVITNRKSTMRFPMSLKWTSYAVSKPPKRGSKTQSGRFCYKTAFFSKRVCYKFSLCENCQRQSCKAFTNFTGLFKRAQMVGGMPPST